MHPRHLIVLVAFVVAACSPAQSASPTMNKILGQFLLIDSGVTWTGDTCAGTGGYADFGPGMGVTVKNEKAEIIGTATTIQGPRSTDSTAAALYDCEVDFTVPVPIAKFYTIEVGHRGTTTESFDQLAASKWHVALTLGMN